MKLFLSVFFMASAWVLSPVAIGGDANSAPPAVIKPTIEVEFNDYFVTNIQGDNQRKYIKLKVLVTAKDQATADAVNKNQPLLRNTVLLTVSDEHSMRLKTEVGKKAFTEHLQQEFIKVLQQQGLPAEIDSITFTEFDLD